MTQLKLILSLMLAGGLLVSACQTRQSNTTANSNSAAGMSHDMSNMTQDMSKMDHGSSNTHGRDMMNMNSDPGAAQQPFDLQFLDSMINHHNGAMAMAKMVLGTTERQELKAFAQKIVDDQAKEIAEMKQLREQWYAGKPPSVNMEMRGMVGGMKRMNSDHMKEMEDMEPAHFDNHFFNMLTEHHEGPVTMSEDALKRAEHPEIRQLAERIIKAQRSEIEQMKKWQSTWAK
jgi:uncharacterized protein (DUF305 family)